MTIKIIGGVLIILSNLLIGFYYGYKEIFRQNDLMEIQKALEILKTEINYSMSTLIEATENIKSKTKLPISKIFYSLQKKLLNASDETIENLWIQSVQENKKYTYFNKEDIEHILSFGKVLGYLDKEMQLINIKILTDYLNRKILEIDKTKNKNKKLYITLSILVGLLILVIIF